MSRRTHADRTVTAFFGIAGVVFLASSGGVGRDGQLRSDSVVGEVINRLSSHRSSSKSFTLRQGHCRNVERLLNRLRQLLEALFKRVIGLMAFD